MGARLRRAFVAFGRSLTWALCGAEPPPSWGLVADSNAPRYVPAVIRSFADHETERLFARTPGRRFPPDLHRVMLRKLVQVDAAERLDDLRVPPGNRLEALKGDRRGQHSIRVNEQWRVCFRWRAGDAHDVAIVDYHR